jgi:hypothetical protein
MVNPLYTVETLPADDVAALREFNDRYIAVMGATPAPSWSDMGELFPTSAPLVTFPISQLALKYEKTEGESRFKTMLHKSFDLKAEEFDTGLTAKLKDVLQQLFAYRNWAKGPERMAIAEARFRNRQIAALLANGENTLWGTGDGIDGENFFSASHLSNIHDTDSTTWSNFQVTAKNVADLTNLKAEVTAMKDVRDENGEKIGVNPDTILVPTEKKEDLLFLLAQNLVLAAPSSDNSNGGVTNPYTSKFNVIEIPELPADVPSSNEGKKDWYLVDSKLAQELTPWLSMRQTQPSPELELRQWDASTDFFKDTGYIKVTSHIWYGFSLGFPHAIRKIKGL